MDISSLNRFNVNAKLEVHLYYLQAFVILIAMILGYKTYTSMLLLKLKYLISIRELMIIK